MRRMMSTIVIPMSVVLLAALPGQAATQTATYVTVSAGVGLTLSACTDTDAPLPPVPRICPAGNVGLGGFVFAGTSTPPTSIRVQDASGSGQGLTICQDVVADGVCQGADPVARICATGGAQPLSGFKPNIETAVFVYAAHTTCEGLGTTGTITLTH